MTPEQVAALDQAARAELWRRGDLSHLRHAGQQQIHDTIEGADLREFFGLCARRYGKSYGALIDDVEFCQATPGGRALYLMPWAKDAALVAGDIAGSLFANCPEDLRPEYRAVDKEFVWRKHDAVLRLKGTNGEHARYLRGGGYHRVTLDECGQMDNLSEIVNGVVLPMTLTTKGRVRYLTTPPDSPGHDSVVIFSKLHERGATAVFTIRDAPHIPFDEKCRMLIAVGERPEEVVDILEGRKEPRTNYAQREFFCRFVVDQNRAVVPEFLEHRAEVVVAEYPRPPHFDCYGAADMGMRDRTGILAGYLDFTNQRLIIEGERLLDRAHTPRVAAEWSTLEGELGYNERERVMRVVDDPSLRVSADLTALGFTAMPVYKPGRDAAIAAMRAAITSGRLRIVGPRCPQLIHQLETAIYKKSEKTHEFERDLMGHFDLVDALIYLVRSVVWTKNPYPPGWEWHSQIQAMSTGAFRQPPKAYSRLNQALYGGTPAGRKVLRGRR